VFYSLATPIINSSARKGAVRRRKPAVKQPEMFSPLVKYYRRVDLMKQYILTPHNKNVRMLFFA